MSSVVQVWLRNAKKKAVASPFGKRRKKAAILPHAIVAIMRRGASLVHVDVVNAASGEKIEIFVRFIRLRSPRVAERKKFCAVGVPDARQSVAQQSVERVGIANGACVRGPHRAAIEEIAAHIIQAQQAVFPCRPGKPRRERRQAAQDGMFEVLFRVETKVRRSSERTLTASRHGPAGVSIRTSR